MDKPRFLPLLTLSKTISLIMTNPRPVFQSIPFFTYTISNLVIFAYEFYLFSKFPFIFKIIQITIHLFFIITYPFLGFIDPGFIKRTDEEAKEYALKRKIHPLNHLKCYDCNTFRGELVYHCTDCDICVEEFDHHCEFVGNCVGKNNEFFFEFFIGVVVANVICAFVGMIIVLPLAG